MQKTWVQSLDWEDPLKEGTATHSSTLAWKIPTERGAWRTTVHGVAKSWTQLRLAQQSISYTILYTHTQHCFSFLHFCLTWG